MKLSAHTAIESWTTAEFRRLAGRALHTDPPLAHAYPQLEPIRPPSDFDLNPEARAELGPGLSQRPAAVLVPVVERSELTLLLTRRTDHLPAHAGQIAFPGGKIDDADESPVAAALREAEEEVGLARAHVEPLGFLDPYRTGTGFRIVPVVAMVRPDFTLSLNEGEVAEAFEVPLSFLMDPANYRLDTRIIAGRERRYYAIPYRDHYIWGATAGMLKNMRERLLRP